MKRDIEIRLAILDVLSESHPYAVADEAILPYVKPRVFPKPTALEIDNNLVALKDQELIEAQAGKLGDVKPRWLITQAGIIERKR